MSQMQLIAVLAPMVLLGVMYPLFQWLGRRYGDRKGWFIGLVVYWVLWGAIYPLLTVGWEQIVDLVRRPKFDGLSFGIALLPIAFAAVGRLKGQSYEKPEKWMLYGYLATALGNGFFEELLWRGTYLVIFPDSIFMRIIYPSVWFGLWHFAPGSLSKKGNARMLAGGAVFLGLLLSVLALQTDSIWWCVLAHSLAGLVMVL